MKRINIFAVLTMSASALFAQTQYDAARITGTELNGTAVWVVQWELWELTYLS